MFCKSCGNELPDGSTFCTKCGAQQGSSAAGPQPSAAKQHNWFRRHKIITALLVVIVLAIGSSIATGTKKGSSSSSPSSPSAPGSSSSTPHLTGIVHGRLTKDTFTLSLNSADPQALKQLSWSDVYCGWDGSHVTVHIGFHNALSAHINVEVQPRYSIKNGGLHGTSGDNRTTFGINANSAYTWWGNAGSPAGVTEGAPVATCAPQLTNVGPA